MAVVTHARLVVAHGSVTPLAPPPAIAQVSVAVACLGTIVENFLV